MPKQVAALRRNKWPTRAEICIVTTNPNVFEYLLEYDAAVLLQSDAAQLEEEQRLRLVDSLLRLISQEELLIPWGGLPNLHQLGHASLPDQLRPYLIEKSRSENARRLAMDIADECGHLRDEMAATALDEKDLMRLRVHAAALLSRSDDEVNKAKLLSLALSPTKNGMDELKGWALKAVWPSHLSAKKLFQTLTPPQRSNFHGQYKFFIRHEVAKHLQLEDLPYALNWVASVKQDDYREGSLDHLISDIMKMGFENIDTQSVQNPMGYATYSRLKCHLPALDHPQHKLLRENDKGRILLAKSLVRVMMESPEYENHWGMVDYCCSLSSDDTSWMLDELDKEPSLGVRRFWARLIGECFDRTSANVISTIVTACRKHPELQERMKSDFQPVDLQSEAAKTFREQHLRLQCIRSRRKRPNPLLSPSPKERIENALTQVESGDYVAWVCLAAEMTLESTSQYYPAPWFADLREQPGWKNADAATRTRIVRSAKKYILSHNPSPDDWEGSNTYVPMDMDGYKAFRLLMDEDPGFLDGLPAPVWAEWAPVLVAFPGFSGTPHEEPERRLAERCYHAAPVEVIRQVLVLMEKENLANHGGLFNLRLLKYCWDDQLAEALFRKSAASHLKTSSVGWIFAKLLKYGYEPAILHSTGLVTAIATNTCKDRDIALEAGGALILHRVDTAWKTLCNAVKTDKEYGKELALHVCHDLDRENSLKSVFTRLTTEQCAHLYVWLETHFPHSGDVDPEGSHFVGPREHVERTRDSLLRHLESLGSKKACDALLLIMGTFPHLTWMKRVLLTAQNNMRRQTWKPPTPETLLRLRRDQTASFVESEDELLRVTLKSLERLEKKLHGETPAIRDLWDLDSQGKTGRPIPENDFSDYAKRHLDDDLSGCGIVVNREVRVHRGEFTDLHVTAVTPNSPTRPSGTIRIIIEVKGCWHREVKTGMSH